VKFGLTKLPKELPTYTPYVNFNPTYALSNQWILLKLNATVAGVNKAIDDYEFGIATQRFQNFW
jgi:valyl-tRNA synthetase